MSADAADGASPDWTDWRAFDPSPFVALLGPIRYRVEGDWVRVQVTPGPDHANFRTAVHGGMILALADVALFAAAHGFGLIERGAGAVTLGVDVQFVGAGQIGAPLEARVAVLKATRGFIFLRGTFVQGDAPIAGFTGTIRKPSRPS